MGIKKKETVKRVSARKNTPIYPPEEQYLQYKKRPRAAADYLISMRKGECIAAAYIRGIGYVDFVWGRNKRNSNKGHGIKHIYEKHGEELRKAGYTVGSFLEKMFSTARLKREVVGKKIVLSSKIGKIVIKKDYDGKSKFWLVTAYDTINQPIRRNKKATD